MRPWLLLLMTAALTPAMEPPRPDVLLILVDDLRDTVGVLGGHPQARTPALDALAARGVTWASAHCAAPACAPSRTALLTGRAPWNSGLYENGQNWDERLQQTETLPERFAAAGYATWGGGKVFHGTRSAPRFGTWCPPGSEPKPVELPPPGALGGALPEGVTDAMTIDGQTVAAAIGWMTTPAATPRFQVVGLIRPHLPFHATAAWCARFPAATTQLPPFRADDLDDLPVLGRAIAHHGVPNTRLLHDQASQAWAANVAAYLACVAQSDAHIGEILAAWESLPHPQGQVVMVAGDHGFALGEKQHWTKFGLWEVITRTPLVLAGTGIPAGRTLHTPVSLLDIGPTLLALAGLPVWPWADGQDLAPLWGPTPAERPPVVTVHGPGHAAVRDARYRYIRYRDGGEELYDHTEDPQEWDNRAADPVTAPIRARLAAHLPRSWAPAIPFATGRSSAFDDQGSPRAPLDDGPGD